MNSSENWKEGLGEERQSIDQKSIKNKQKNNKQCHGIFLLYFKSFGKICPNSFGLHIIKLSKLHLFVTLCLLKMPFHIFCTMTFAAFCDHNNKKNIKLCKT